MTLELKLFYVLGECCRGSLQQMGLKEGRKEGLVAWWVWVA